MKNPAEKESLETHGKTTKPMIDNNEPDIGNKKLLDLKSGLPNHGTRWARAKNPTLRVLNIEERTAPQ